MIRDSAARQLSLILRVMARLDLSDEERLELLRLLRGVIAGDRFPLSPRIRCLRQSRRMEVIVRVAGKLTPQAVGAYGEKMIEAALLRLGWIPSNVSVSLAGLAGLAAGQSRPAAHLAFPRRLAIRSQCFARCSW